MKEVLKQTYAALIAERDRLSRELVRVTTLLAAHDAFAGKAAASPKATPMKKRGRPKGSRNVPKVNGAVPVMESVGSVVGEI